MTNYMTPCGCIIGGVVVILALIGFMLLDTLIKALT